MNRAQAHLLPAALWLCCASITRAQAPAVAPLRMAWAALDHPSAVYHAKDAATLEVDVENPGVEDAVLQGAIAFGLRVGADGFKTLSLLPVKATSIAPGARAKIPLNVTLAGAGTYGLRWLATDSAPSGPNIPPALNGPSSLECIFAPRTTPGASVPGDPRWLALLPPEATHTPAVLHDLAIQTGVTRFLIDERFAFDAATGVSLPLGAAMNLPPDSLDSLFAQAAAAKLTIVLRITVPMDAGVGEGRAVEALHQYVAEAIRRGKGTIVGLVIAPEKNVADRATYRAFYLAAYGAAKGVATGDRNLLMLGAGTAAATRDLLLAEGLGLRDYVDAVAVTDTTAQIGQIIAVSRLPVWVLPAAEKDPWSAVPPAVALAQGAAIVAVPPPNVDRGVAAHLLGGAAWYQTLSSAPAAAFVSSFQGDGYAVAAVAGLGAGTPIDALLPGLAHARTIVSPLPDDDLPPYPQLEIADSSGSLRVVDAQGAAVDCRQGDTLYLPAAERPVYVLQSGSAEDLMGVLRSGRPHRLAVAEIAIKRADDRASIMLQLTNITDKPFAGTLRLLASGNEAVALLGETKLPVLTPGKLLELPLSLNGSAPPEGFVVVEIATTGTTPVLQRTALRLR